MSANGDRLFGTDGIRGIPGEPPLLPDTIRRVASAAGRQLDARSKERRTALIARDTRRSGAAIARQLAEGLASAGVRAVSAGVLPTPALSYLTARWGADLAVMVSASHNPAEFNGIKFFRPDGLKLDDDQEHAIERRVAEGGREPAPKSAPLEDMGAEARREYLDYLRSTFPANADLSGMKIVVDTAHGAASDVAAPLLESLGAKAIALGCRPTGTNINLGCGALDTAAMRSAVVRHGADLGFSVDGDADRVMFSDGKGRLLDGDHIVAYLAEWMQPRGLLRGATVVATVMSNAGFVQHLKDLGVGVIRVSVGDRHVTKALMDGGFSLGGESSGHIVLPRFAKTGDGLLTALQVLAAVRTGGESLTRFRSRFVMYPQELKALAVERKVPLEDLPAFQREMAKCKKELGEKGRILIRYSGTEPVLRLLAEGPSAPALKRMIKSLVETYRKETRNP